MKALFSTFGVVIAIALVILAKASLYTVDQRFQAVITQFGKPVGEPIIEPGLHWKTPFVQTVNTFPRLVLEWDGPAVEMQTKDKLNIIVDNFARWRIVDPLTFLKQMRDERTAQSRLDDILGSETRNVVARHNFIEMVRTTKGRKVERDPNVVASIADARLGTMPDITVGRQKLEEEILSNAKPKVLGFGIELLDLRMKRVNYNPEVSESIHDRMISERRQIAERFRSEGAGEAAKIEGNRERDLKEIESQAYKKVQELEGAADAKALEIYARAYNSTPEAVQMFDNLYYTSRGLQPTGDMVLT